MNPNQMLKAAKKKLGTVERRHQRLLAMREWLAIMAGQSDEIDAKQAMLAGRMIQDAGRLSTSHGTRRAS